MRSVGIRWVDPRGAPAEQAWRIAVCLHAGLHGAHAHEQRLELDTAKLAIELADWFAAQQLEILSVSREKARRETWDEVLSLLADRPEGIRASDVYRARIVRNADEAHALLAEMRSIAPSRLVPIDGLVRSGFGVDFGSGTYEFPRFLFHACFQRLFV